MSILSDLLVAKLRAGTPPRTLARALIAEANTPTAQRAAVALALDAYAALHAYPYLQQQWRAAFEE